MFKLHDVIPVSPEIQETTKTTRKSSTNENTAMTSSGKVVYIHPEGRFYTVEFLYPDGSRIRETKRFTPQEFLLGLEQGMFPKLDRRARYRYDVEPIAPARPRVHVDAGLDMAMF